MAGCPVEVAGCPVEVVSGLAVVEDTSCPVESFSIRVI